MFVRQRHTHASQGMTQRVAVVRVVHRHAVEFRIAVVEYAEAAAVDLGAKPAEDAARAFDALDVVDFAVGNIVAADVLPTVGARPDGERRAVDFARVVIESVASTAPNVLRLPQLAFVGSRADHRKAPGRGIVVTKRSFLQHLAALFRCHVRFVDQIPPAGREYAGPAYSVAVQPVIAQLLTFSCSDLPNSLRLLFADQREAVLLHHLPGCQRRMDDFDVGRLPNEAHDFGELVARRAEHAFEVLAEDPARQVQQHGGVEPTRERHVRVAVMLPTVCKESIDSSDGVVNLPFQRPRLPRAEDVEGHSRFPNLMMNVPCAGAPHSGRPCPIVIPLHSHSIRRLV